MNGAAYETASIPVQVLGPRGDRSRRPIELASLSLSLGWLNPPAWAKRGPVRVIQFKILFRLAIEVTQRGVFTGYACLRDKC